MTEEEKERLLNEGIKLLKRAELLLMAAEVRHQLRARNYAHRELRKRGVYLNTDTGLDLVV